jgi:hypothetical protein
MLSQGFLDNSGVWYEVEVHIFIFFCQPKKIFLQNFGGFEPVNPSPLNYALDYADYGSSSWHFKTPLLVQIIFGNSPCMFRKWASKLPHTGEGIDKYPVWNSRPIRMWTTGPVVRNIMGKIYRSRIARLSRIIFRMYVDVSLVSVITKESFKTLANYHNSDRN